MYTSSKAGDRFSLKTGRFNKTLGVNSSQKTIKLAVNKTVTFSKDPGIRRRFHRLVFSRVVTRYVFFIADAIIVCKCLTLDSS